MTPSLSLIIPTRERASYLRHSVQTGLATSRADLEVLILDNASTDDTADVVSSIKDSRVRYSRSEARLSMRDNFERGLKLARGDVICFIGDDDGWMPHSVDRALHLFEQNEVDAVASTRAHYFWPDLLSPRRNTALLPRASGVEVLDSRQQLRSLLRHLDYYRLPCLYHGFVRRSLVERIRSRHGRFFLSSQVDIYSAIAISAEGIRFAFSRTPLVINGGSSRSNGASHFGGGGDKEKALWKSEDDLGFLPGFDDGPTLGALILESALRYCAANGVPNVDQVFAGETVDATLRHEQRLRSITGKKAGAVEQMASALGRAGIPTRGTDSPLEPRWMRLVKTFLRTRPVDMSTAGVTDIHAASLHMQRLLDDGGTRLRVNFLEQLAAASRLARG